MDDHELEHLPQHKDELCHGHHSPIPAEQRASFGRLRYLPPARDLVFELAIEPADGSPLKIATSDGSRHRYRRTGGIRFAVHCEQVELVCLSRDDEEGFFLPSRDVTSGTEAHGAGRYLDVTPAEDGRVDVNLAYNPSCAYDDAFCCPLPPPDNWLAVPLGARESGYAP